MAEQKYVEQRLLCQEFSKIYKLILILLLGFSYEFILDCIFVHLRFFLNKPLEIISKCSLRNPFKPYLICYLIPLSSTRCLKPIRCGGCNHILTKGAGVGILYHIPNCRKIIQNVFNIKKTQFLYSIVKVCMSCKFNSQNISSLKSQPKITT